MRLSHCRQLILVVATVPLSVNSFLIRTKVYYFRVRLNSMPLGSFQVKRQSELSLKWSFCRPPYQNQVCRRHLPPLP
ncbi:uncharacterized protein F5147DRAFT_671271 [Suillus discolor]|uniref:Uncharacterized protein n=1 Tax=Suillus discolor TaxID=1912936 RepID=A0A9P7FFM3_9AGAM|nr:uncharacterized protein F5147DRAFT_671271 [Suillus discolor]KAG2117115.1 hypothetical protein F5147DRAFT_671271 [Suillus discolor]